MDPQANLTDVYSFIRQDEGTKVLCVIVNCRPFSNPGDGVSYEKFSDDARYSIHLTDPSTGVPRVRYDFQFSSVTTPGYKNLNTILNYGLGTEAGAIQDVGDALSQKARETMDVEYYSRAEAAFTKALELDAKDVDALNGMAWVAGSRHEFEQSIDWAKKAVALDPKNHTAYGLWGDADVEMGNYDAAFQHLRKMLDVRPDLSSYSRGAHLLFVTGNVRQAALLMQKAIAAGAPHAENTAWCRAQLGLMLWNAGYLIPNANGGMRQSCPPTCLPLPLRI